MYTSIIKTNSLKQFSLVQYSIARMQQETFKRVRVTNLQLGDLVAKVALVAVDLRETHCVLL